jgi:hypothetical protein
MYTKNVLVQNRLPTFLNTPNHEPARKRIVLESMETELILNSKAKMAASNKVLLDAHNASAIVAVEGI